MVRRSRTVTWLLTWERVDPILAGRAALCGIGGLPVSLASPTWDCVGSGRFPSAACWFGMFYATAQRRVIFIETVTIFRPSPETLAALQRVTGTVG